MNKKNQHIDIHTLIDLYFEGETTISQEKELRIRLAQTSERSDDIEEARAVMGVMAAARSVKRRQPCTLQHNSGYRRKRQLLSSRFLMTAAASVAVILGVTFTLTNLGRGSLQDTNRYAMAAHTLRQPDDPEEIHRLISAEMGYMAEAESTVNESIAADIQLISLANQ